ncbi:MAG: 4-hydroxy-tetrahydrodipicolinate synthase [Rhizobiales bacterium]|nr:4-hydroxy-tetrahydrodipicolinate synthase [Hyphomicrobiales bacterium]
MFKGSIPALITPLRDGAVDGEAFQAFVEWQIAEGSHGVVPVGTTGESPTLTHDEHKRVVEMCVEAVAGRVPVIAGTGSNATAEAIDFTQHAKAAGADAALVAAPYYNKPTQEGLYQHFKAVAESADLPIFIYNVPGRSVADVQPETMARLFRDCSNIVGIKDATADLTRPSVHRHLMGPDLIMLSGEDGTALGFNAHGGVGCISVTANVAPRLCSEFQEATLAGDYAKALAIQDRLMPLHKALFCETSPSPVKYAAAVLGRAPDEVRLPLVVASASARKQVDEALRFAGLMNI